MKNSGSCEIFPNFFSVLIRPYTCLKLYVKLKVQNKRLGVVAYMRHDDCLFCKIIAGEVPSAKVYEDEDVYAFMDISQVTTGHTLIIPKVHTRDIYDTPDDVASKLFARVPKIAKAIKKAYNPKGLNLLNNNEIEAGQSVFHFHIHLIPRYGDDDGFGAKWITRNDQFSQEDLHKIAEKISNAIE